MCAAAGVALNTDAAAEAAAAAAAAASPPRPSTGASVQEPDLEHGDIKTLDVWHCTSNVSEKGGHNVRAAQSKSAEVLLKVTKESVLTGHESQHGQQKGCGPGGANGPQKVGAGGSLKKQAVDAQQYLRTANSSQRKSKRNRKKRCACRRPPPSPPHCDHAGTVRAAMRTHPCAHCTISNTESRLNSESTA